MIHPQAIGFTPRYEWRGRERCIVWRHCGADAQQGNKQVMTITETGTKRIENRSICRCTVCGLSI